VRVPGVAFLAVMLVALAVASWAAFRPMEPSAAAHAAISPVDPEAELARARAARRSDAIASTITTVLLEHGVTRGDVRSESIGEPAPSGFARTELAVDVPGASGPVAEDLQKRIGALDGAVVSREPVDATGRQHLSVRLDGEEVAVIDLYAAPLPEPPPELSGRPRVAIVIDDLGWSKESAEKLLAISHNLTYSIIPTAPFATDVADIVHAKGAEVMLHLPMEPEGHPGGLSREGMLMHDMPAAILKAKVDEALLKVPYADGVNNHMGSLLTADEKAMTVVMGELATRDVFFLDSRTTPKTVAFRLARAAGMRAVERDVFLDDVAEIGPVLKQIEELEAHAKKHGSAVAIGHPYPATIAALNQAIPELIDHGLEIVPARDLAAAALTPREARGTP